MIRPKYVKVLVGAKLRAKPGRSALVVAVSSILFGIALGGLTIFHAGIESAQRFSESTFHGRHYVMASYANDSSDIANNKSIQQQAKKIYEADIAKKKAAAQKLGIDFDPRTVPEPLEQISGGEDGEMILNTSTPSAQQAISEYQLQHPDVGIHDLEKIAKPYSAKSVMPMSGLYANDGSFSLMKDGKEVHSSVQKPIDTSYDFMAKAPLRMVSSVAVDPFIDTSVQVAANEIPITVPYAAAETVLGLSALDPAANATDKLNRLEYLHGRALGVGFSVCYRNTVSSQQIDQALNDTRDKESPITYAMPKDDSCTAATVTQDKRSAEEKLQAQKQQLFDKEFGVTTTPVQQKLSFRIVGLVPDDVPFAQSPKFDLIEVTRAILKPSWLGTPTLTNESYESLPSNIKLPIQQGPVAKLPAENSYLVEFASAIDANRFISEKSCDRRQGLHCGSESDPFQLVAYGDGGVTFISIRQMVDTVADYVIGAIVVVAIMIMIGTFGRIISDERHEMAVFRALGATRLDITLVYVVYAAVLTLFAAIIAIFFAELLALLVHILYAHDLTVAMRLTYGELDPSLTISLVKIDLAGIIYIVAIIVATGIVSVGLPLQHAIQRDIIQDLKDE